MFLNVSECFQESDWSQWRRVSLLQPELVQWSYQCRWSRSGTNATIGSRGSVRRRAAQRPHPPRSRRLAAQHRPWRRCSLPLAWRGSRDPITKNPKRHSTTKVTKGERVGWNEHCQLLHWSLTTLSQRHPPRDSSGPCWPQKGSTWHAVAIRLAYTCIPQQHMHSHARSIIYTLSACLVPSGYSYKKWFSSRLWLQNELNWRKPLDTECSIS